jgi:hypothetical protein
MESESIFFFLRHNELPDGLYDDVYMKVMTGNMSQLKQPRVHLKEKGLRSYTNINGISNGFGNLNSM